MVWAMSATFVPVALVILSVVGVALFGVAYGIFHRLGRLIDTIAELRQLAIGNQGELVRTKEEVSKARAELVRVVDNTSMASELVRKAGRFPTR